MCFCHVEKKLYWVPLTTSLDTVSTRVSCCAAPIKQRGFWHSGITYLSVGWWRFGIIVTSCHSWILHKTNALWTWRRAGGLDESTNVNHSEGVRGCTFCCGCEMIVCFLYENNTIWRQASGVMIRFLNTKIIDSSIGQKFGYKEHPLGRC